MLLVMAFGFPFSTNYSKGFVALFSLFPWTILGKGIRDLASATTGTLGTVRLDVITAIHNVVVLTAITVAPWLIAREENIPSGS